MVSVEKGIMKEIIQFHNVSKSYGRKSVIKNVTFSVKEGSFTTLIGCNGAGKSTTLRLMAGLESCEGNLSCFGQDPFEFNSTLGNSIFLVHESLPINFPMSLENFVRAYKEVFSNWNETEFQKLISIRALDLTSNYLELSRGQKVQFTLCLALSSGAKVLLCDEVTSVLDFDAQFFFLEQLKKFCQQGGTVVMTTNILSELDQYADHVILLQDNKVVLDSSIEEVGRKYILLTLSDPDFKDHSFTKIRDRDGYVNLHIAEIGSTKNDTANVLISIKPKLEDVLLHHIKKLKVENENLVA